MIFSSAPPSSSIKSAPIGRQAITAPGDVVLVPDPSYPIHAFGFLMAGGVIRSVPSDPTPDFFNHAERAILHSIPKPIAIVVAQEATSAQRIASSRRGRQNEWAAKNAPIR